MDVVGAAHDHADEREIDGCVCDIDLADGEAVADRDLPAACGGIELVVVPIRDDEPDDDEVADTRADVTADRDLPAAVGGVAS